MPANLVPAVRETAHEMAVSRRQADWDEARRLLGAAPLPARSASSTSRWKADRCAEIVLLQKVLVLSAAQDGRREEFLGLQLARIALACQLLGYARSHPPGLDEIVAEWAHGQMQDGFEGVLALAGEDESAALRLAGPIAETLSGAEEALAIVAAHRPDAAGLARVYVEALNALYRSRADLPLTPFDPDRVADVQRLHGKELDRLLAAPGPEALRGQRPFDVLAAEVLAAVAEHRAAASPGYAAHRYVRLAWDPTEAVVRWWLSRHLAERLEGRKRLLRTFAYCRACRIVLAILGHERQHGLPPKDLSALADSLPPATLVDPFTGKAFRYVRNRDAFSVWSTGPAGTLAEQRPRKDSIVIVRGSRVRAQKRPAGSPGPPKPADPPPMGPHPR